MSAVRTPLGRVRFAAVHTAMAAWFGQATVEQVRMLREMAEDLLPEDCETRRAVVRACIEFAEMHHRVADVQSSWGDRLRAAMLTVMRPDPVDLHRSDIHG